jgi:hypothetical protein
VSPQGTAALYGVVTFAILGAIFMVTLHYTVGWPFIPEGNRAHGTVLLAWYALCAFFARAVGQHGARGATLGQAWRAALGDVGRAAKGLAIKE